MVFTLGLRHTFALWQRALALVQFPLFRHRSLRLWRCRKNLPLAATPQMPQTVTIKSESGVTLLATLHGESRNAIIRISPDVADPEFALDNHAPAADLGYLWFRDVHDWPMISGSLDVLVASTADAAERVVYSLLERLLETSEQVHCRIQLVEPKHTLVQTGEGEIFADGRA